MGSGLDVYLEKLNGEPLPEFPVARVYTEDKPYYTLPELKDKYGKDNANKLDNPQEVVYYCRVNGDKITWGYMKQLDDNLVIKYNKDNNTFTINKI